ncbi:glycosyltransferase family 4 protein [Candidatus Woesearchaeota archaeon]|nr:glycosyltransferase family 4 protein [Candidatus Woesearchaeota archaeon]
MKILIISIGPIFKNIVHGGSQKILRELALFLGQKGHQVTILCTRREDNSLIFQLGKNVLVKPILLFKEIYPSPYETAPFKLAETVKTIAEHTEMNDVIYCHDSQTLLFQWLWERKPIICSFRDFSYNETLGNAFLFERDALIVNSEYAQDCVLSTIGRFQQGLKKRIKVIKNGVNLKTLYRDDCSNMRKEFGLNKNSIPILFPHRADYEKGLKHAMFTVSGLVARGFKNVVLLIPYYVDKNKSKEVDDFYEQIRNLSQKLKIKKKVKIHPWIPYERMREYYSLGKITLCLGDAAETFGSNVALESLSCGTIPILSMTGAQRSTLPGWIAPKVDVYDVESTIDVCVKILKGKISLNYQNVREFLHKEFSYNKMLKSYETVLKNTKKNFPLKHQKEKVLNSTRKLSLAPWCYISKKGMYIDYDKKYLKRKRVHNVLENCKVATVQYLQRAGVTKEEIIQEYGITVISSL